MKKFLTSLFLFIFASISFSALSGEPPDAAEKKPQAPKAVKRIDTMLAVFDLETVGNVDKNVSRPLSESIRREVVKSGKWELIDRGNMDKVLGEQKFQLSGCVTGQCIVEAGQLLGVGKIVAGSVSLVGKTYYLSLSLINVESGEIEKSSEDECKCELEDLIQSSKRLVKRLLAEEVAETKTTPEPEPTPKPAETKQPPSSPFSKGEFKDLTTGIEMVFVKGGCYQMGDTFGDGESDEKPVHEVCVDDYYIGKYEVTQGQWKAIMGNNPSYFKDCGDNCPVEQVSWNDIQDFMTKLNNKTGKNYRLPTEAEWEYAAKSGGKSEKYAGGNDIDSVAWYTSNSGGKTHPVGQKTANGLGIYDMSGNVWEWVNDWYGDKYYGESPKNNPKGSNSGSDRVLRGGCWGKCVGGRAVS